MSYQPPPTTSCPLAAHGSFQPPLLVNVRRQGPGVFNGRVNQVSPRQNRVVSPQARESWRAPPESVGYPPFHGADARRQMPRSAASIAANARGTRSFEPPQTRRELVVQGGGRENGGDVSVPCRGREGIRREIQNEKREIQNENRREGHALGGNGRDGNVGKDPQFNRGRDLVGGREPCGELQASAGRRLPASGGRGQIQINSTKDRPVGSATQPQVTGARDRQGSSGRRPTVDGQIPRVQPLVLATRPRTPPLRTTERTKKKLETAQQTLSVNTLRTPVAPVRKGVPPPGLQTTIATQQGDVVALSEESPNAKTCASSPPVSPPGSQGSPSTVPRVSCSGRSSSPSTVRGVASPNSAPHSHANSPNLGANDASHPWPFDAGGVHGSGLNEQASLPKTLATELPSVPSALTERDPASLSHRTRSRQVCDLCPYQDGKPITPISCKENMGACWPMNMQENMPSPGSDQSRSRLGNHEDCKPKPPIAGTENMGASPVKMQENISSPGSDHSEDTSVSFNLSPMRRVNVQPSLPYSLSCDTMSLGSSLPAASLASAPQSLTTSSAPSSAPSRRESVQPPASEPIFPQNQVAPESGDAAAGPAVAAGTTELPVASQGNAANGGSSNQSGGSKVAVMKSLWEKRSRASTCSGADASGIAAESTRTPGGVRRGASWLRCASDMNRRMKHDEMRTSQLTQRLLERAGLLERDADYGSPNTSSGDTSDLISTGSGQDDQDSPSLVFCKGFVHNSNAMWRSHREMSKAIIRVLSLDSGRDGARNRGQDADCPRCGCTEAAGNPVAVDAENRVGLDSVSPHHASISGPVTDAHANEDAQEVTPRRMSINTEKAELEPHGRSSLQSTQPDSEGELPLGSPEQGNEEQSSAYSTDAEPARSDHDAVETVPSTVELNSSTEATTPLPESPDRESAADRSTLSVDDSFIAAAPRATEDGMQRSETMLQQIEQSELSKELRIIVPDGMSPNRLVSFLYEGRRHEVEVPTGYEIGSEVPITIAKRPPLEQTHRMSLLRCHAQFDNRGAIVEVLRHSPRPQTDQNLEGTTPGSEHKLYLQPEFRHRQYLYSLLRGQAMHPLLPYTPEDDDLAEMSGTE